MDFEIGKGYSDRGPWDSEIEEGRSEQGLWDSEIGHSCSEIGRGDFEIADCHSEIGGAVRWASEARATRSVAKGYSPDVEIQRRSPVRIANGC